MRKLIRKIKKRISAPSHPPRSWLVLVVVGLTRCPKFLESLSTPAASRVQGRLEPCTALKWDLPVCVLCTTSRAALLRCCDAAMLYCIALLGSRRDALQLATGKSTRTDGVVDGPILFVSCFMSFYLPQAHSVVLGDFCFLRLFFTLGRFS